MAEVVRWFQCPLSLILLLAIITVLGIVLMFYAASRRRVEAAFTELYQAAYIDVNLAATPDRRRCRLCGAAIETSMGVIVEKHAELAKRVERRHRRCLFIWS